VARHGLSGYGSATQGKEFLTQEEIMKLSEVLAAALALTPNERLRLVDAIALVDDWHVDIVDKPEAEEKVSQDLLRGVVGVWEQPKSRNRKAYTTEELIKLHELASRMDTDLFFCEKQQREAITEAAKRFGRTYKAIAEKIRTIRAE
jgi:hypothetical protein